MKIARLFGGIAALCAFIAVALLYAGAPARGFDLQGSPTVVNRPRADILDTYFFPSPANQNNVVAVMDVYPFISPANALGTFFDQSVLYTMKFDNQFGNTSVAIGAKPTEDLVLQFSFSAPTGTGQQTQQLFVYGPAFPAKIGTTTVLVNSGTATGTGFINKSFMIDSGISIFAGARRNPAFLSGTLSGSQPQSTPGTYFGIFPTQKASTASAKTCLPGGTNTCPAGFSFNRERSFSPRTNVLSIVAEIPKATLATAARSGVVAYWATTSTEHADTRSTLRATPSFLSVCHRPRRLPHSYELQ